MQIKTSLRTLESIKYDVRKEKKLPKCKEIEKKTNPELKIASKSVQKHQNTAIARFSVYYGNKMAAEAKQ